MYALALLAASCTSPATTDTAFSPPVDTTSTTSAPPPTTTSSSTTSTTAPPGPDIVAWLAPSAPAGVLQDTLWAWGGIATVELIAGEDALEEFNRLFPGRPDLTSGVPAAALPASLRIELSHPAHLGEVSAQLRSLTDVTDVVTAVTPTCSAFPGWNVVLFVVEDRDLTRLRNDLLDIDGLDEISVVSRQTAYEEFLARFSDPGVSSALTARDFAVSLRARSSNPVALAETRRAFQYDPAVAGVHVFNPGAPECP